MSKKFLVIRFSSFGDIVQALTVTRAIKESYPDATIDWVVRSDFSQVLTLNSQINNVWSYDKSTGLKGLLNFAKGLRSQSYDYIYDAHSNLRSFIIKTVLFQPRKVRRRKKYRLKRFLLFRLGINFFPKPFRGMISYQRPLQKWGVSVTKNYSKDSFIPPDALEKVRRLIVKGEKKIIILVPSAAWKMKRWPLNYWRRLIKILPGYRFVILGGPDDTFCSQLEGKNVLNMAGKLSLIESCAAVSLGYFTVSADTGLLHVADYLGKRGLALIGPTAFGFTTSKRIELLEVPLECRPCSKDGRGTCSHEVYQKCMIDISPERAANCIRKMELTSDL